MCYKRISTIYLPSFYKYQIYVPETGAHNINMDTSQLITIGHHCIMR